MANRKLIAFAKIHNVAAAYNVGNAAALLNESKKISFTIKKPARIIAAGVVGVVGFNIDIACFFASSIVFYLKSGFLFVFGHKKIYVFVLVVAAGRNI